MTLNEILLTAAALLPAIVLCVYVFKMDRVEKEPVLLLLKLFLTGALCCFPAAYIEGIVIDIIDTAFSGVTFTDADGTVFMSKDIFYIYNFVKYLIGVAFIEEGLKWISMYCITKNTDDFNCLFDGMIYAIFVSLGFAALENVFYVLDNGWGNAVMRAVLSVPGHMFFAVMMGYHYSFWNVTDKARNMEDGFKRCGLIPPETASFSSKRSACMSLVMPVLAHTVYNFCCTAGQWWSTLGLYIFVIFMYVHCFRKIKKMSRADAHESTYVEILMNDKYPYLANEIREESGLPVQEAEQPVTQTADV